MIEKIRDYIATCPYLDEFTALNVNYLVDKVKAYSVNESAGYNPVVNTYLNGDKEMQFLFSFDAKLYWSDEVKNNIDNSAFFEKFRNGYIFATNSNEAIYRISCRFNYLKIKGGI